MEKTLKSGKKVVLKEVTALEDLLAYQLIGTSFDDKNALGGAILHRRVQIVLGLVSIDGVDVVTPATINDVYAVLLKFKKKEWDEVETYFDELNGDTEELPKE